MKEINAVAYIFERKLLREDDNFISYILEPIRVQQGKEIISTNGNKILKNKDVEFEILDSPISIKEEYVYAFPCEITSNNNAHKALREQLSELKEKTLFQIYDKNNRTTKEYYYEPISDTTIALNASDPYSLFNILFTDFSSVKETAKMAVERTQEFTPKNIIYSDNIFKTVSKTVICQDEQIKKIATAISKNQRAFAPELKSNMLICGQTGVGKTEIFRSISKNFGLPMYIEDVTEYTANGYKGKDVTDMLIHLYMAAGCDLEKAEHGIIVVDEIDKKISKDGEHDVYTSAVIQTLLKMIEGHKYILNIKGKDVEFDTSYLTFAFQGAFSGIEEFSKAKSSIGFTASEDEKEIKNNIYTQEALIKYGMLPEFLGRNDTLVVMNSLTEEDLAKILKESDKSHLKLYKRFFETYGVNFRYDEETINAIAHEAVKLKTGARSLRTIVENALEVANYFVQSSTHYHELTITPLTIEDNKKYILK